jgi:hypothetical protein
MRKPFRTVDYGKLAEMLEGAFLPIRMLDEDNVWQGLWWGTSRIDLSEGGF